ncbi:TetR/AcrR family transcriptional regulator [Streptomyces sp. TR06-5]|uniref:TetR/AcrR family transcriptional regulator n=1 Tax=unclassified Streptomyces TaxID=2593676 RepID=UPI0039A36A28
MDHGCRRRRVLDAAIEVLGAGGLRRLTYQAVDAAAGVPPGTTSEHFRTREALLDGLVAHLVTLDLEDWDDGGEPGAGHPLPTGPEEFAVTMSRMVLRLVGPGRNRTLARYQILVEASARPSLRRPLEEARKSLLTWGAGLLRDLGASSPEQDCRTLFSLLDGLMLQQLTLDDEDFDPLPSVRTAVRAILPEPDGAPVAPGPS